MSARPPSLLAVALAPAVARAVASARRALLAREEGAHYPVHGVNSYIQVRPDPIYSPPHRPRAYKRWEVIAERLLPAGSPARGQVVLPALPEDGDEGFPGASVDLVFDSVLRDGAAFLASAWESNMLALVAAGVPDDVLRLAVDEALARYVIES